MNLCVLPWIHFETTANGNIKPCCLYEEIIPNANLNEKSLNEIWNGDYMNNLRNKFLKGEKPKQCSQCWAVEASGNKSKRIQDNERFSHHFDKIGSKLNLPVYLDLKLGTVCNIKCRTCNSFSSFKWAEDEKKAYGEVMNSSLKSYWLNDDSSFWKDIEQFIPNIEYLDFSGGEPFLIKKHVDILRTCVEKGYSNKISLHYNTNGTITPTDEMFKLWKEFKWVEVMFSIDNIEDRFEYLRHPAKWKTVEENFDLVRSYDFLHTTICCTISSLNVYYLPEFLEWIDSKSLDKHNLYLNLLHNPEYYCIKNLSTDVKSKILKKLNKYNDKRISDISNFLDQEGKDLKTQLIDNVKIIDNIRNEDFSKTFSEFYGIIND